MSAASQHLKYQLMKDSGTGLSEANQKRLERAHDRMEALVWQQVTRTPWKAAPTPQTKAAGSGFSIQLEGLSTSGVLEIGPFSIEQDPTKPHADQPTFGQLTLAVDSARADEYSQPITSGLKLPVGILTYYRTDAAGRAVEVRLTLKAITLKPGTATQETGPRQRTMILLTYTGLELTLA